VPIVQAYVVGAGLILTSIGYNNIGTAIAVEISDIDIARRPACVSERAREREAALSVIEIDDLLVRGIIPDDNIEVAVTIQIGERRAIRPIRPIAEILPPVEVAPPIV
jgi:hypothetical protein